MTKRKVQNIDPNPVQAKKMGRNGKGRRDEQNNAGRSGSTKRRRKGEMSAP
jgi:hypothetical protein